MPLSDLTNVQRDWFRGMDANACIQSDFTEFSGVAEGVIAVPAGAGAGSFAPPIGATSGHPGIWNLLTGATAVGRVFIISRANSYTVGAGSGETRFESWIQLPVLSTPLERYTSRTGFYSIALPNVIVQAIGFEYDDSQNGGRWQAITFDGAETSNDTGILVVAGDWYKHSFVINAAGTEVQFFIDDVLVATNTTNLPTGIGFSHFVNIMIMKLIGVGNRSMLVDAYAVFEDTGGRE